MAQRGRGAVEDAIAIGTTTIDRRPSRRRADVGKRRGIQERCVYVRARPVRLVAAAGAAAAADGGGGGWSTDYPDSDFNFSYRLQQLTSLKVNPDPIILRLTDDELFDYPFIYMIEPGALVFDEQEVAALRKYLLNGGFLMVDDFWGDYEYQNFYEQIKRVFPEPQREPQELPHRRTRSSTACIA